MTSSTTGHGRRIIQPSLIVGTALLLCISAVQGSSPRWEPQIAVLCEAGQAYHPQHLSEEGRWTTDLNMKSAGATCLRDKIDLLEHCKRVYPGRDITNIVESSHYQKIGGWCRQGALNAAKCKGAQRWIKPFRCLEGPFQSDALLVPEGCLFDHIHNASRCWPFARWNQTGAGACQDRGMQMRSFAMLLPCGISLFSGVEFVCCPKHFKVADSVKVKKTDLPVVPPSLDQQQSPQTIPAAASASDMLSALSSDDSSDSADSDSGAASDDDGEDDLDDDESDEDMMADDANAGASAAAAAAADLAYDDYDSDEDGSEDSGIGASSKSAASAAAAAAAAADRSDDDGADEDEDDDSSWDSPAAMDKPSSGASIKEVTTTTTTASSASSTTGSGKNTDEPSAAAAAAAAAEAAAIDPYFTHFDPRAEHQSYKDAQQRLEETHREKVTRVMKDWSDLEEKYQDMRLADPKSAQTFKQRMTARFQALEEEGNAEKHQMAAMHQQRVLAHINQRKREAMNCYTQSLIEQPPSAHRVEKCLQKLLRALHKDRAHALAHYRHLLSSGGAGGLEAAASERPRTLERLVDIDRAVNQSMSMLKRYPELSAKLAQLMDDYIQALRSKDDTPGAMLGMTETAEAGILDKYREEIERKVAEKDRQRIAEKQRKEARSQEREKLRDDKLRAEAKKLEVLVKQEQQQQSQTASAAAATESESEMDTQQQQQQQQQQTDKDFEPSAPVVVAAETTPEPGRLFVDESAMGASVVSSSSSSSDSMRPVPTALPTVDDAAVQRAVEEVAAAVAHQEVEPRAQHVMGHDLGHGEAAYAIRHEAYGTARNHDGRNVYFTMVFAGIAVMAAGFVGVVVSRWRSARHPHAQGFVEVDQTAGVPAPVTPEEKHVVNMQINGYENPTYKYFEVKE